MDRTTAVTTWREVCGSDAVMAMPPTGRQLEEFARRIEVVEREACKSECSKWADYWKHPGFEKEHEAAMHCHDSIAERSNAVLRGAEGVPLENIVRGE